MNANPMLDVVSNVVYYGFDCAAKMTKDTEALTQLCRLFNTTVSYVNLGVDADRKVLQPLAATVKIVTEFAAARSWVSKANALLSGDAAGKRANGTWSDERVIWLTEDVSIPNFLKIISMTSLLASDVLGTMKWLDSLQLMNLGKIVSFVGNTPVLGSILIGVTLESARQTLGIVGFVLDIADAGRDIMQNGLSYYNIVQVVGNIAKITGIVLVTATGNFVVIALVANGTASLCFLARFAMKHYQIAC